MPGTGPVSRAKFYVWIERRNNIADDYGRKLGEFEAKVTKAEIEGVLPRKQVSTELNKSITRMSSHVRALYAAGQEHGVRPARLVMIKFKSLMAKAELLLRRIERMRDNLEADVEDEVVPAEVKDLESAFRVSDDFDPFSGNG